jgi:hypothetical protein
MENALAMSKVINCVSAMPPGEWIVFFNYQYMT